ncbi:MAG: MerR family transcriptional regulator [Ramlibacter sp.]
MRISELSQRTGVTPHALRHYERLGLLSPARTAGGYRDYGESARREVIFIAMSRKIGFPLKAIAARLPDYRAGHLSFDDMIAAMRERIVDIDREIDALNAQRAAVVDHVRWLREQKARHRRARASAPPATRPWPEPRTSPHREKPS